MCDCCNQRQIIKLGKNIVIKVNRVTNVYKIYYKNCISHQTVSIDFGIFIEKVVSVKF